jgi:hypothetical protein
MVEQAIDLTVALIWGHPELRKTNLKYCPGLVDHYTFPFSSME